MEAGLLQGYLLRSLVPRDATAFLECTLENRVRLSRWMPSAAALRTAQDATRVMKKSETERKAGRALHCGLWHEKTLCGYAGLYAMNAALQTSRMGYWIDGRHEGRGTVTVALQTLVRFGFQNLGLSAIEIHCAVDNKKSLAVPGRLQFSRTGTLREAEWLEGQLTDHAVFRLTRETWLMNHPQEKDHD